jgi:hypothetical protein
MLIPHTPDVLVLPIMAYWDGTPCANTRLHGVVTLGIADEGFWRTASYHIKNARVCLRCHRVRVWRTCGSTM